MDRPIEFSLDINANRQIERSIRDIDANGVEDYSDFAEEWGFPAWKGNSTIRFEYEKWRLQLRSNFISSVDQDVDLIDPFSDIYDTNDIGTTSDTCLGGDTGVICRDVGFADNYLVHSLSLSYIEDNWAVTVGARNFTNKVPPLVDGSEVTSMNNSPIGYGYDLMGRTLYVNFGYDFGSN